MTKAAFCLECGDIVAPLRAWREDRSWRWCQCNQMGVRWRDGYKGQLEVSHHMGEGQLRVIGLNNQFLEIGAGISTQYAAPKTREEWRELHDVCAKVCNDYYLFHESNRNCWALVVKIGESGDVFFIPYDVARSGDLPGAPGRTRTADAED